MTKIKTTMGALMAKDLPEELPVMLNIEESGTLCHLIMGQEEVRKAIFTGKAAPPVARAIALYNKLADANDKLMGKKPL